MMGNSSTALQIDAEKLVDGNTLLWPGCPSRLVTMDPSPRALEGAYEAENMLDIYIYDFLKKRKFEESAKAFLHESKLPTEQTIVAIDAPGSLCSTLDIF